MTSETHRFFKNAFITHTISCLLVVGAAPSADGFRRQVADTKA